MSDPTRTRGFSMTEVLLALALVSIVAGFAMANMLPEVRQTHDEAAARYVLTRVRQARAEALQRGTNVGIRFEPEQEQEHTAVQFRVYADGNSNGLRTRDIDEGVDPPLGPAQCLEHDFAGAKFGIASTLPPIEPGGDRLDPGADPIRVGAIRILSFGPTGRGSSGTLYIRGPGEQQYAIRIYGPTGRVRLMQFRRSEGQGQWVER